MHHVFEAEAPLPPEMRGVYTVNIVAYNGGIPLTPWGCGLEVRNPGRDLPQPGVCQGLAANSEAAQAALFEAKALSTAMASDGEFFFFFFKHRCTHCLRAAGGCKKHVFGGHGRVSGWGGGVGGGRGGYCVRCCVYNCGPNDIRFVPPMLLSHPYHTTPSSYCSVLATKTVRQYLNVGLV